MTGKLFAQAIGKFLAGVILVGVLVFLPAGTLAFANGWLFMGILFVPMFAAGLVMLRKNPALLQKRLQAKESRKEQSLVVRLSGLMFVVGFVLAGLGVRFGWYMLPRGVAVAAAAVFLAAPLVLGSVYAFAVFLVYPFLIAKRIKKRRGVAGAGAARLSGISEKSEIPPAAVHLVSRWRAWTEKAEEASGQRCFFCFSG